MDPFGRHAVHLERTDQPGEGSADGGSLQSVQQGELANAEHVVRAGSQQSESGVRDSTELQRTAAGATGRAIQLLGRLRRSARFFRR